MKRTNIFRLEYGFDFITLNFKNRNDMISVSQTLYRNLDKFKFLYKNLQRKDFNHQPGDPLHFHTHELASNPHFHVLYPHEPTEHDKEFLTNMLMKLPRHNIWIEDKTYHKVEYYGE